MALRPLLAVALLLPPAVLGCTDDEGITLWVDVRTDLRPGAEFAAAEIELRGAGADRTASAPALATHDFLGGRRVAELSGLAAGDVTVHVALVDATGSSVAQRTVELSLDEDTAVTVVITGDCIDLRCPRTGDAPTDTECHGGLCVDPRCHAGDAPACGTVECATDAMCTAADGCSRGTCAAGVCLFDATECSADAGADAGPPDAGTRDAGSPDAGRPCAVDGDCPSSFACSDGTCVGRCRSHPVPRYSGSPCAQSTIDCVVSCMTEDCVMTCFGGDPSGEECEQCYRQNGTSCINEAGCQAEWDCYATCRETGDPCDGELMEWYACGTSWGASADMCAAAIYGCAP